MHEQRNQATRSGNAGSATLSIGELARRAHVSPRTIRFYEEQGILPAPPRSEGGTRRYPEEYVFYLEGARIFKELGFSLEEIAEIGKSALTGESPSEQTRDLLRGKLDELEHRVRVLRRLHRLVTQVTEDGPRETASPSILTWLSSQEKTLKERKAAR